jgi:hypothetical protein
MQPATKVCAILESSGGKLKYQIQWDGVSSGIAVSIGLIGDRAPLRERHAIGYAKIWSA